MHAARFGTFRASLPCGSCNPDPAKLYSANRQQEAGMDAHLKALENFRFACSWLDQAARPGRLRPLSGDQRGELLIVGGDRNDGQRGLWLKLLDRLELGFAC
jgi:hypothetical protein